MQSPMAARRAAFTLVELLVVMGIIALLMGMLMPSLSKARQQAQSVVCQSNLRQIGHMLLMYSQNNKDVMFPYNLGGGRPPRERWPTVVFPEDMLRSNPTPKVLVCPADEEYSPEDLAEAQRWNCDPSWVKHSYVLNMHLHYDGIKFSRTFKISPSEIVVMGEKKASYSDYRMNCMGPGQSQYKSIVENERHGRFRRSNLLFLDLHVSNEEPPPWRGAMGELPEDPWDVLPGGNYIN